MKNDDNAKQEAQQIRAPSYFSRPEKRAFLAAIAERSAGNRRISPEEIDCLIDYTAARSRIQTLGKIWRRALREDRGAFRTWTDDDRLLKVAREIAGSRVG